MKLKTTILLSIVCLLVLASLHLNPNEVHALAKDEQLPQIRLVPSASHVEVGETFEVAIWMQGFIGAYSDIEGFEVHVNFDPALLQPITEKGIETTLFPKNASLMTLINSSDPKGSIKIGQALTQRNQGLFSGYGKIGTMSFKAKEAGEAKLTQAKSIVIKPENPGINIIHKINHPTVVIGERIEGQNPSGKETTETVGDQPKKTSTSQTKEQIIQSFKDYQEIAKADWAVDAIAQLAENRVIQGSNEGKFEPKRNMTRAEFAKAAVIALGLDMKQQKDSTFSDIQKSDWFYDYVETAAQHGLIQGSTQNGKTVYIPQQTITRAEISTILSRVLQQTQKGALASSASSNAFQDVHENHWAKKDIDLLAANGLMKGRTANQFAPNENATRAEVCVLLVRLLEYKAK